jgi:hypothetical protein
MSPRGTVVQGLVGIGFGFLFILVYRRLRRPGWIDTYPWPRDLFSAVCVILGCDRARDAQGVIRISDRCQEVVVGAGEV